MKLQRFIFPCLLALLILTVGCSASNGEKVVSSDESSSFVSLETSSAQSAASEAASSKPVSSEKGLLDKTSSAPKVSSKKVQSGSEWVAYSNSKDIIWNDSTGIPDKAFYQAILKTKVNKNEMVDQNKDGILQKSEIKRIPKAVNWDNKKIQSIQGIENLPIFEIHLNGNEIVDISPLAQLSGAIKTGGEPLVVYLKNNKVTSLNSFGNLLVKQKSSHIKSLDLSSNLISDISPMKGTSIEMLVLSHNKISKAGAFFSDNQSFYLDLSYNQLQSLGDCNFLAYSINLSHNKIATIKSFTSTADELSLSDNRLADVSFLKGIKCPGPSKLDLSNNELYVLPNMKKWRWTNLTSDQDGKQYMVRLEGNHLSRDEMQTKLPTEFYSKANTISNNSEKWLKDQVAKQRIA